MDLCQRPSAVTRSWENDALEYFSTHPTFGALPGTVLEDLSAGVIERSYPKGQRLFYAEDPASFAFVLKTGLVALLELDDRGSEHVVLTYLPGDIFGQVAILLGGRHARSATAIADSVLLLIPDDSFIHLYRRCPELAELNVRQMSEMLHRAQRAAIDVAFTPVVSRVARFLVESAGQNNISTAPLKYDLALSHQELAFLLGTTRETITRAVARLARDGLIAAGKRRVIVLRPEALRRFAGG